ncbi:hypothetical protein Bpfe_009230 [Biomphalaria pfeifferi]|uniref:Uncharacterized protein n=1 Tax=Biomphalaria pfeifferi TaxID=112525 RepID=A0AAD8BV29_BIOPF|nr:hypothetical protein Bpfe_009230 [Biomphalaria pfeifferi]
MKKNGEAAVISPSGKERFIHLSDTTSQRWALLSFLISESMIHRRWGKIAPEAGTHRNRNWLRAMAKDWQNVADKTVIPIAIKSVEYKSAIFSQK